MNLYLSNLNILHCENCPHCSYKTLIEFKQSEGQSDINFLVSTVAYLANNFESSIPVEICPHCLGKRYNLLSSEFNLILKLT